jgi:pimeloyl-ACP methyl ester carboxylesterase
MKYNPLLSICTIALLLQFSCHPSGPGTTKATTEKIQITDQGVNIAYDDTQQGDTTLLFVHGWCIDKSYWKNQTDFFRSRYRVVSIDLPGFGASGKNRDNWSVEAYGKDLSAVIQQLNLKHIVLIGHSMSGQIIVETALQNKDRVIGLVGVDNFKSVGDGKAPAVDTAAISFYNAARKNYKEVVLPYASEYLFLPSTDSVVKQRVLQDIANADPVISINCLEQGDSYPGLTNLAALKKRIYLINSDATPTDTAGLIKKGIPNTLLPIHASGHYPMMEKPAEFNDQLERGLEMIKIGER